MPPKRISKANKRKTEAPSPTQKWVRNTRKHNDNVSEKGHLPSQLSNTQGVEQGLSDNAPISSRTRSRCKKRTLADEDAVTLTDHAQHPKRRRINNPTEQGTIEEVVQDANALLLPVELHSLILETFWKGPDLGVDEAVTIRSCTSVCKVWRAAARPHLFRSTKLNSQASLERLTSLIRSDPSVTSYIRRVILLGDGENCKDGWIYAFPSAFETPLPALKILEIREIDLRKPRRKDIRAYCDWIYSLSALTSVHQLNLGLVIMSPKALTALVRVFPSLTKVWMEQVHFLPVKDLVPIVDESTHATDTPRSILADNRPLAYPILHPPASISSLKVDNFASLTPFNFDHLKDWFVPEMMSSSLANLDLMRSVHVASVGRIIAAASSSLDILRIPTQGTSISQFKAALDSSKLVKLRTFRIHCCNTLSDGNEMAIAYHLLSILHAPNLEIISLIICYDASKSDDFQPIDQYLEKLAHLKEVRVEYFAASPEPLDVRRKYIEQNFPLTFKRGLLRVKEDDIEYLPYYPFR
ncbi:hypothetical protein QCA50_013097 [Cerrena zonata]|uniref:F-box domain-containing protein n=1 Tax=Cerrena zonata TaxID=2478898 RepID=A0AAW0FSF7_9APHY